MLANLLGAWHRGHWGWKSSKLSKKSPESNTATCSNPSFGTYTSVISLFSSFTGGTSVRTVPFLNLSSLTNHASTTVTIQVWCFLESFFLVCEWLDVSGGQSLSMSHATFYLQAFLGKGTTRIRKPLQGHRGTTLHMRGDFFQYYPFFEPNSCGCLGVE